MFENAYDLDIALDVVFSLHVLKCKERDNESDIKKKHKLQEEIDMMSYERDTLYKGEDML